jgi:arylsulfatase A-like enzyme
MAKMISRRDFLKISSAFLGATVFSQASGRSTAASGRPNIIVLIFDAMSARHLSVYGYTRRTTPNFERFAQRATVYHNNYACANFTSSGTATLLSGLDPWTHRAFNLGGLIARDRARVNIFSALGPEYFSVGFSQNVWADNLLRQMQPKLDFQFRASSFSSYKMREFFSESYPADQLSFYYAFDEYLSRAHPVVNPIPGSISLGFLDNILAETRKSERKENVSEEYPYGLPSNSYYFYYENRVVFHEMALQIRDLASRSPFMGYFHFYAPHSPFAPHKDFVGIFEDRPLLKKPRHPLAYFRRSSAYIKNNRDRYDEYIANIDFEFGKLLDTLEAAGILENSYLVLASDHGEVFERDEVGHGTALLYEPVIHTPLLISAPKQSARVDVTAPTTNADLLPTFAQLAGQSAPPGVDGRILPGLGGAEDLDRPIFALEAKENSAFAPLTKATVAMRKQQHKLIYYTGYPKYDQKFELFDLEQDPEELNNLFQTDPMTAKKMKDELLSFLDQANRPFRR